MHLSSINVALRLGITISSTSLGVFVAVWVIDISPNGDFTISSRVPEIGFTSIATAADGSFQIER